MTRRPTVRPGRPEMKSDNDQVKGENSMVDVEMIRDGGQVRVLLHKKLTAAEVPELQPALKQEIAAGAREMIFDMADTVSLDSTGIGLLIAASNSLAAVQGAIRMVHVSPNILKLLRSMRLVDRLHAQESGEEVTHGR
jgi:anti-anti-sigma factor